MQNEMSSETLNPKEKPPKGEAFPSKEMRSLVADLFEPRPLVFWSDFLLSITVGWAGFAAALFLEAFSLGQIALLAISSLALYRGIAFIHELTHLRPHALPGFRFVWNLLCGLPLLLPDFTYMGLHLVHHSKRDFGTHRDAEYVPFGRRSKAYLLKHVPILVILPLVQIVRFAVMAPLSLTDRGLRRKVTEEMSAIALRIPYKRDLPVRPRDWKWWIAEEVGCSILVLSAIAGIVAGVLPIELALQWYAVMAVIAVLNFIRTVGATHLYATDETTVTFKAQFLDSVNVVGASPIDLLLCPVGLRFHALHHLFPAIPYHHLGTAHRRLMEHFSEESTYAEVNVPSLAAGCAQLWHGGSKRRHRSDGQRSGATA